MPQSRSDLEARLTQLEARVLALETELTDLRAGAATRSAARSVREAGTSRGETNRGGAVSVSLDGWTKPYQAAELEMSETWIEIHEQSARPHLHRMIKEVVQVEGPVTEKLVVDRVRRAWGLRRAGGRVQEAIDQAIRQLVARGIVIRKGDALFATRGGVSEEIIELDAVRVPTDDDATKRGVDDVPLVELALAVKHVSQAVGVTARDELTLAAARVFGWTRRGGAIQERMSRALDHALEAEWLTLNGDEVAPL